MKKQISIFTAVSMIAVLLQGVVFAKPLTLSTNSLGGAEGTYTFDLSKNISSKMTYSNGVLTYAPTSNGYQSATLDIATQKTDLPTKTSWAKLEYDVMVSDYETCWSAGMANYINTSGQNIGSKDDAYAIFDILPIDEEGTDARVRAGAIGAGTWASNRYSGAAIYTDGEWNHIEYYADLSGSTALLTMKINDSVVKTNIDSTITDMAQIGNLHFGFKNTCVGNKIQVKNVVYSWMENVTPTPVPTVAPTPTPNPSAGGSYTYDFEKGDNVSAYGFGSSNSTYGYDATEKAGYFQTVNSQIQYKVQGQKVVPNGFKWYKLSAEFKTNDIAQISSFMRLCESSASNEYDNLIFQCAYNDSQKSIIAYGCDGKKSYILNYDFSKYHKFDVYAKDENNTTTLYLYIDDALVGEYNNSLSSTKFGLAFFQTTSNSTVKGWVKNCTYAWSNNSLLPSEATPTPVPTPTPTPVPGQDGGKHIVDFTNKSDVNPYNYGTSSSVYGYDAANQEAYFQTTNSQIQYKILGQNFVKTGFDWYHMSYEIKTNNPQGLANLGRIDESPVGQNEYSNTIFQIIYDANQKTFIAYGVNTKDPGVILVGDFTKYHKIDVYMHNESGASKVYLFFDGSRVGSWNNGNFAGRFGQMFIQSAENSTQKTNLKNCYYEWGNNMILPDEIPEEPADDVTQSAIANKGAQKIVYIGGSITEVGGLKDRWSTYLTSWLNENVPGSSFTEINSGIGGTDSKLGLVRTQRDIVQYNPDVVFIEFAVNDRNNSTIESAKCMEGIIRQLMAMPKVPYVVGVGVVSNAYDTALYARERATTNLHKNVLAHYGIKYIDVATYMDEKYGTPSSSNTKRNSLFNTDQTHPNSAGHAFYATSIESAINSKTFQKPVAETNYSDYYKVSCKFINAAKADGIVGDWTAYGDGDWNETNLAREGSGLKSSSPDASLTYYFNGSVLYIGSRFDKANGQFKVVVDGVEQIVDGYYPGTSNQPVSEYKRLDLGEGEHTLVISPTGTKTSGSTGTSISIDYIIVDKDANPEIENTGITISNVKINDSANLSINDVKGQSANVGFRLSNYADVPHDDVFVVAMVTDLNGKVYAKATTPLKNMPHGDRVDMALGLDIPNCDLNLNLKLYTLQGDNWNPLAPAVTISGRE